MVRLEDPGRALADSALADLLRTERDVLAVLGAGEHERLSGLLRDLLTTLDPPASP
jgi:hypothetical protein